MNLYGHNSGCFGETLEPVSDDLSPADSPVPFKYIDLHIGDYLGGSEGMSPEEEGIYIRFLVRLYGAGKPFSDDDRYMAHLMRLDLRAWRRIKAALVSKGKIIIRCGCLTNKRFETERVKRAEFLKQAAQAARKGWAKRAPKDTQNVTLEKADTRNGDYQNDTPLTTSAGLRPNFGRKFVGSSPDVRPNLISKSNKINDLEMATHILPIPIPLQEERESIYSPPKAASERESTPSEFYVNGVEILCMGTRLPYVAINATADALGIPQEVARQVIQGAAEAAVANREPIQSAQAWIVGTLKALKIPPKKAKRTEYTEGFEDFWKLYPRKEAKGEAANIWDGLTLPQKRKAYRALKEQLDFLIARSKEQGNMCPHARTWLNQGRFDDEPEMPGSQDQPSSPKQQGYNGYQAKRPVTAQDGARAIMREIRAREVAEGRS